MVSGRHHGFPNAVARSSYRWENRALVVFEIGIFGIGDSTLLNVLYGKVGSLNHRTSIASPV